MSALPPDGAVFLYYEQNQVMIAALLRASRRRSARRRSPATAAAPRSTRPSAPTPDGTPWVSAAQCGGEIGPFGANAHGDADSQMLSYLANGIAVAVEAVESEVPVVVLRARDVADSGGAGLPPRRRPVMRDYAVAPARGALADDAAAKAASGFGVNGGGDGGRAASGSTSRARDGAAAEPRSGRTPREATPLAGVVDPETNAPIPTAATSIRTGSRASIRRRRRRCATSTRAVAARATRSSASPSG